MDVADHLPPPHTDRRRSAGPRRRPQGRPFTVGLTAILLGSSALVWGGCAAGPSSRPLARDDPGITPAEDYVSAAWLPEPEVRFTFDGNPADRHRSTPPALDEEMYPPTPCPPTPCHLQSASADGVPTAWLGSLPSGPSITSYEPGAWTDHLDRDRPSAPMFAGFDAGPEGTPDVPERAPILAGSAQGICGSIMSFAAGLFMLVVVSIPAGLAIASSCFGRHTRAPPAPI